MKPEETLTDKERRAAGFVALGLSNKKIGAAMGISEHMVKRHMQSIFDKVGVDSRLEVALWYRDRFPVQS